MRLKRWLIMVVLAMSLLLSSCQGDSGHPRAKKVYAQIGASQPQIVQIAKLGLRAIKGSLSLTAME